MKQSVIKRREEAQERQIAYDKLIPQQKLNKLDKKLGKGIGTKKQRKKLKKDAESQ